MRGSLLLFQIVLLGILSLINCSVLQGAPREDSIELRKRALSLKNTDPELLRSADWIHVSESIQRVAEQGDPSESGAELLILSASMKGEIYRKLRSDSHLESALAILEELIDRRECYSQCPAALLLRGELLELGGRGEEAKSAYLRLRREFSDSELSIIAGARIRSLSSTETSHPTNSYSDQRRPIVIDAGHGGEDLGAVGVGGIYEKDVTLAISREAARILKKQGYSVKLTRDGDRFVPLAERTSFANDLNALVFVSIHTNASPEHKLSGTETYILDNSDDAGSLRLAERENASLSFEGSRGDLDFILSDLIQSSKLPESLTLANLVQRNLIQRLSHSSSKVKDLGVKKAPFYVLVGAHMPSILVEVAFIDHAGEGSSLAEVDSRSLFADGIARGIHQFLEGHGNEARR